MPQITFKKLQEIANYNWLSRWAGSYTFISCSYWGPQYFHSLKKHLGVNFTRALFFHKQGTARFYVSNDEFRRLGKYLAVKSERDSAWAKKFCLELKHNTDYLLPLLTKNKTKIPTLAQYKKFLKFFDSHLAFHVFVKKTVDFLSPNGLERLLKYFQDARVYSESVYSKSEEFFRSLASLIGKNEQRDPKLLTCLTQAELEAYLKSQVLPSDEILRPRFAQSALYYKSGKEMILTGSDAARLEELFLKQLSQKTSVLKGISAFPGRVRGTVRVVSDPHKKQIFNKGDILVTGMTRPEFMPYIRMAGAIVTDVGGILCHAAITARELKLPCVVGTVSATKIFKSGDKAEIDAAAGVVRKLG